MNNKSICLLNDAFPPLIDGVANAVTNYGAVLQQAGYHPVVITPDHPEAQDEAFPYPVIRYPSLDLRKLTGYMAGVPFSPEIVQKLNGRKVSLLHSHCPIASTILARELRPLVDAPLVLTYHTKFDIDIANITKNEFLQERSIHALVSNINACDEVWAVSEGAAANLRSLGYEGDCIVMPNGVDLPRGQVSENSIEAAVQGYDLPDGIPLFLFVGRIMWYKGLRIIVDALAKMKHSGDPFRMVFIGAGADLDAVKAYVQQCGIAQECIFTGAIREREVLRAWYCRADLFLFPSTFDTNGLVVREAAACGLGTVLIQGSCAAEGITDGRNGLLIAENADSMYACLHQLGTNTAAMAQIGQNASNEIYISWEDAVHHAMERYEIVIDRYQSGRYPHHLTPVEDALKLNGSLMEDLAVIQTFRHNLRDTIHENLIDPLHHTSK